VKIYTMCHTYATSTNYPALRFGAGSLAFR
jgi:hypothetical protein